MKIIKYAPEGKTTPHDFVPCRNGGDDYTDTMVVGHTQWYEDHDGEQFDDDYDAPATRETR